MLVNSQTSHAPQPNPTTDTLRRATKHAPSYPSGGMLHAPLAPTREEYELSHRMVYIATAASFPHCYYDALPSSLSLPLLLLLLLVPIKMPNLYNALATM